MSLIDLALDQVPDLKIVPPGSYTLETKKVTVARSKSGNPVMTVVYKVVDEPNTFPIYYYGSLPTTDMDEQTALNRRQSLKQWCLAHSVKPDDFQYYLKAAYDEFEISGQPADILQLVGIVTEALIAVETYEGRDSNKITRFIKKA